MATEIYFSGSITGGRQDAAVYKNIIEKLKQYGIVLTEHVGSSDTTEIGDHLDATIVHDRDVEWLHRADILVAEVTTISDGVGYEIGQFIGKNSNTDLYKARTVKPSLILWRPSARPRLTKMISGIPIMLGVTVEQYETLEQAEKIIADFMKKHNIHMKQCVQI